MDLMTPFSAQVDLTSGIIPDAALVQERRLSDMQGLYNNQNAEQVALKDNPLIYKVHLAYDMPSIEGQMAYSTTIIQAGKIGKEYFMTKGHYHANESRGELYYGISGQGLLLMQTKTGKVHTEKMIAGTGSYVPPHWGHRTINTGTEPFVFLAVYPADAGYDYASIAEKGFASLVVEEEGQSKIIPNPLWSI